MARYNSGPPYISDVVVAWHPNCHYEENTDHRGDDIGQPYWTKTPAVCCADCGAYIGCQYWAYDLNEEKCYLKDDQGNKYTRKGFTSGKKPGESPL